MNDDQIKHMVDKFLAYRFPEDIQPDGGLSIRRVFNEGTPHEFKATPSGTNLLDAAQATDMVRHMVEGLPAMSPQEDGLEELRALSAEAAPGMWKAEQWGDGSSHADSLNVVAPDSEVVLATDIFKGDAAFIIGCINYVRAELERTGGTE